MRSELLLLLLTGCGARTGLPSPDPTSTPDAAIDTFVEETPADTPAAIDTAVVDDRICVARDAGGGACGRDLVVASVTKSSATCFIDTPVVAGARGRVECSGGAARVTFGAVTFVGGFDGDTVDACSATSFVYTNGCRWRTAQRVVGSLASGKLSFTYSEAPEPGESGCASSCSATGVVEVR